MGLNKSIIDRLKCKLSQDLEDKKILEEADQDLLESIKSCIGIPNVFNETVNKEFRTIVRSAILSKYGDLNAEKRDKLFYLYYNYNEMEALLKWILTKVDMGAQASITAYNMLYSYKILITGESTPNEPQYPPDGSIFDWVNVCNGIYDMLKNGDPGNYARTTTDLVDSLNLPY